ncbi:MAG: SDR family NAD(P)-dependent oxidoreductase [bacterium]|nr:SDR family NAD(P)-dependent oxidoreductase [bacterium]
MGILNQKTALITGGGRGIGRGIAFELAKEGADIVVADLNVENAQQTVDEVQTLGQKATSVKMDVTDEASVATGIETALSKHDRIDILVNNAGVVGNHTGAEVTLQDWDMCFNVNLKGIWIVTRALVDHFKANQNGKIINISSIAGRQGTPGMPAYSASKSGVISLTQSLAQELGPFNINVNAVCPGLLWTDIWRKLEVLYGGAKSEKEINQRNHFNQYIANRCPLGREQTPEDIGMAIAFLASDHARNITGQALNVDGGIKMN